MNCLAHAIRFLDQKWYAIGTGLPDWLGMCDRKVRLRPKHVDPHMEDDSPLGQLCKGIHQHWIDDDWFHVTPAFHEVTAKIGTMFREKHDAGDNYRSGFVGHIAMELLLDGVLSEHNPSTLDSYYALVASIDGEQLQDMVNSLGAKQTDKLVPFLKRYREEEFIRDYLTDEGLLYRLNRVLARVKLDALPAEAEEVIAASRELVRAELSELTSPEILTAASVPTAGS